MIVISMIYTSAMAVAAKHLAAKNIHNIGIVGTGVQAKMQLEMLWEVVDCKNCFIWGRDPKKVERMIADLQAKKSIQAWELEIKAAKTVADLVVADSISQCVDHGECPYPVQGRQLEEGSILELGNVIKNPLIGRTSEDEILLLTETEIEAIQCS